MDESDATLWVRCLGGDGTAMVAIFKRHERRLFRAALRDADSTHDAEDVVAAVFMELWRLRDRVNLVADSLLPWLLVTLANVSRNASRARRRHHRLLAKIPADPPAPDAADEALGRIEALNDERRFASLLQRLKPADRQILLLVMADRLSIAAAAAALGISQDAAKARLTRARRRARLLNTPGTSNADGFDMDGAPA